MLPVLGDIAAMTAQNRYFGSLPEDRLLPRNTRRSVPIMLLRAREAVMSHFRPFLASHGLSEQQWRVIRVLGEVESLEAREVCERACILAPSLTRILKIIEDRGLVTRSTDPTDRRRLLLSITPKGGELLAVLTQEASPGYADFVDRFGAERIELLLGMLADIADLRK